MRKIVTVFAKNVRDIAENSMVLTKFARVLRTLSMADSIEQIVFVVRRAGCVLRRADSV